MFAFLRNEAGLVTTAIENAKGAAPNFYSERGVWPFLLTVVYNCVRSCRRPLLPAGMMLALKLQNAGCGRVDYAMVWDQPHCEADYPGEVLDWIDSICQ